METGDTMAERLGQPIIPALQTEKECEEEIKPEKLPESCCSSAASSSSGATSPPPELQNGVKKYVKFI